MLSENHSLPSPQEVEIFRRSLDYWINEDAIDETQKQNRISASDHFVDVYKNSKTDLNLCNKNLTSLPKEIGSLTSLQSLNLYCNQLTSLPEELFNLTSLKQLHLYSNQLTSLPQEIKNLTSLEILDLSFNQITSLCEEITDLKSLKTLHLCTNQISSFPIEICNLKSLMDLGIDNNQIKIIPEEIKNLNLLQKLDFSENNLESIPLEIFNLRSLKKLVLLNNRISSLPPEIRSLTMLEELYLANNELSSLPPEIRSLTMLEELDLANNELSSLPPEIENLNLLKRLNLSNNQLTSLPPEIENLNSIRYLSLNNNHSLPNTPAIVAILENIEQKNANNPDFYLRWPDHIDREPLITSIKQLIFDAYKEYFSSDPDHSSRAPNIYDYAKYPTFVLTNRFMSEFVAERNGIKAVTNMMMPVSEKIRSNPALLKFIDPISSKYLDGCVNQPVAGFSEIANLLDVALAPTILEKLESARIILAIDLIRNEITKLGVGAEVEVELANAMLREVHSKLISEKTISKPWSGIPEKLVFEQAVTSHLTEENIQKITLLVKIDLAKPLTKVANSMCEGTLQDFWSMIILDKKTLDDLNKDVLTKKCEIQELDLDDPEYSDKLQNKSAELQNLLKSSEESILKKSRELTSQAIEETPDHSPTSPEVKNTLGKRKIM